MKCIDCGNPMIIGAKSCSNCGRMFGLSEIYNLEIELKNIEKNKNLENINNISHPNTSNPVDIFKKISLDIFPRENLIKELSWLKGPVNYILCKDGIAIIPAKPVTKIEKSLDVVTVFGSTSLAAGAITLPVALVADIYQSMTRKNGLDTEELINLFSSGNAVWIEKSKAKFFFVDSQGGLFFGKPGCLYGVEGCYESVFGAISMCICVSDWVIPSASVYRKPFGKSGFDFTKSSVKSYDDLMNEVKSLVLRARRS